MKAKIIDVHHHVFPPEFTVHPWDMEQDIEDMERLGISGAVMSAPLPVFSDSVRKVNEFMAEKCARNPSRYGFFAAIPYDNADVALREIEYAEEVLHADGFALSSHIRNIYIGDDCLDPVFDELNKRKAKVFLHPSPKRADGFTLRMPTGNDSVYEFVFDTTRAFMDYIYRNKMLRNPDVQWILAHAGGTIPYLTYRLSHAGEWGAIKQASTEIKEQLSRVYYELALSFDDNVFSLLKNLAGVLHILFGTDYPATTGSHIAQTIEEFKGCKAFDLQEKQMVLAKNVQMLFPRFSK